jgi:uroporphyrinogen III methyltransferase/synthase
MSDAGATADRPLAGRHIAITRPPEQVKDFARLLEEAGARVTALPSIAIAPLEDMAELDGALEQLDSFNWVVLTSANGVQAMAARASALGQRWTGRGDARFAVIGPATARSLEAHGIHPDFVPAEYVAEAIAKGLGRLGVGTGHRVLLLRADIARRALADELRAMGAEVVEIAAYRTVLQPAVGATLRRVLHGERLDAITFTSSSTVHGVMRGVLALGEVPEQALADIAFAAIGPITAATLREYGLIPSVVATEYTIPGLLYALTAYLAATPS